MEDIDKSNKNRDFLQSTPWRKFQEAVGRKTHFIENDGSISSSSPASSADRFSASLIEHVLPIVGKYLYSPRGPVVSIEKKEFSIASSQFSEKTQILFCAEQTKKGMQELLDLAKRENAGWIRIEPKNEESLELIRESISVKNMSAGRQVVRAPHDMQPKEVFVLDISKNEEQLLAEMKPKTRYNINLAKKKGVTIVKCQRSEVTCQKYVDAFLDLTKEMAVRQGITAHPEKYYRKMIETLPAEMLKIYVAEYENQIIAANLMVFYDGRATYSHGASGAEYRNVMAPFLLQWQAILDAKASGCTSYDFGGVKTTNNLQQTTNNWEGITNFKFGFSPNTKPIEFPGSYDIVVNPRKYAVYRGLQRARAFAHRIRK